MLFRSNSAVSRLGSAEGKITNIETTKANKTEVASLARTTLKAEWDKSANDAARSAIDSFKVTYANDQIATASSVNSVRSDLTKKIDNMSVGTNILPNSDFASDYDGWSMHNWNAITGLSCGFNLVSDSSTYAMKDSKVFWVRDNRTTAAAYKQVLAQSSRNRFSVVPGDILQASVYVAGWGMTDSTFVWMDFYNLAGQLVIVEGVNQNNTNGTVDVTLNGGQNKSVEYTTLDRFHRIFQNCIVPPGAAYGQISIRFSFRPNPDSYGFFVRPQVCQISSLSMNSVVPYQISTNGLSAQIVETKTTAANIDGKVNSLYTLKVESVGSGKRVVSGLMLGTNEDEGQFGVIADKFFIGNTQDGSLVTPFIVNTVGSTATVVLKGDLIADGTILGKHIAASQTISAPNIVGGSLNIADRFKVMSNGDVLIQAASGNTGMKLTSERIDVYDTSGKLRVRMGKLT